MKIALFTDTYLPQINGVTNTLKKLLQFYKQSGIEYKVFAPQYENENTDCNTERFYSFKFLLYPESRVALPSNIRINQTLEAFQPDIIHLMTEINMGYAGLRFGKKHRIPVISNYTTNFSQYTAYYNLNFLKQPVWNYMKWFHTQSDLTLCPSYAVERLLNLHGIHNTKIFSRGIDMKNYNPLYRSNELRKQLGIHDKTAFLYVGRVSVEKDLDVLCKSYQNLQQRYPGETALVITGDGPYLKECKKNFPDTTIFTGYKSGKELADIYASCDIFVCPSSTETFGNVILEAMASGLPVIGADALGVGENIKHNINGIKFTARNEDELFASMEKLLLNSSFRDNLIKHGLTYATAKSWDHVFQDLNTIYEEFNSNKKCVNS